MKSNEICQYLVEHINQSEYIVLDLNYEKLYDDTTNYVRLHETLIFGYDLNERFLPFSLVKLNFFNENTNKYFDLISK